MSQLQIDQVLSQIRSLAAQTQSAGVRPAGLANDVAAALRRGRGHPAPDRVLRRCCVTVLSRPTRRSSAPTIWLTNSNVACPEWICPTVMLEANKANLSLRAVTEVRNRLISAYTDIMNMQM